MLFLDYMPTLNETEVEVYKYIANNTDKITYMTIRELADETHTSSSTIWNFCQKFECDGYSEFKFRMKEYLNRKHKQQKNIDIDETVLINFLTRTNENLIEDRISKAAHLLASKEFVFFIGEGTSKILANYGEMYFSSFFTLSTSISHPLTHPISRMTREMAEKVGVIAFTVSGETNKIVKNLNYFSELGIDTVTITNSDKSLVAEISTVNIPYYIPIAKNKTANITSQVPALFLIEKLGARIASLL